MKDIPVQDNYFIALYFLGHYLNNENIPEYLKEKNFKSIRSNIDRIFPSSADSKYWLERQPSSTFDAFALSNICELMDDKDTHKLFAEVIRTAKPGARIIFRNLMIPREVPEDQRLIHPGPSCDGDSHGALLRPVGGYRCSRLEADFGELAISLILIKEVGRGIVRDVNVGATRIVEISPDY